MKKLLLGLSLLLSVSSFAQTDVLCTKAELKAEVLEQTKSIIIAIGDSYVELSSSSAKVSKLQNGRVFAHIIAYGEYGALKTQGDYIYRAVVDANCKIIPTTAKMVMID